MATRKQETGSQARRDRKIGEEGGSWQIETSEKRQGLCEPL